MTNLFLAVLLSQIPLHGHEVYELDVQVRQLGKKPDLVQTALARFQAFSLSSLQQKQKLAALAAICDLPATNLLSSGAHWQREDLQLVVGQYLSLPPSRNSNLLLAEYADAWQPDWPDGPVEEAALKRMAILTPEKADEFITKLHFQGKDAPALLWYQWRQLRIERKKARAAELEKQIRTEIEGSSTFDSATVTLQIPWPQAARFAVCVWPPQQQKWFLTLIDRPGIPFARPENWTQPAGNSYQRSWQTGPSWQVTFEQNKGKLTRRCTYVETDSYVSGNMNSTGFSERIVVGETVGPIRVFPAATQIAKDHPRRKVLR